MIPAFELLVVDAGVEDGALVERRRRSAPAADEDGRGRGDADCEADGVGVAEDAGVGVAHGERERVGAGAGGRAGEDAGGLVEDQAGDGAGDRVVERAVAACGRGQGEGNLVAHFVFGGGDRAAEGRDGVGGADGDGEGLPIRTAAGVADDVDGRVLAGFRCGAGELARRGAEGEAGRERGERVGEIIAVGFGQRDGCEFLAGFQLDVARR